MALGLVRGQETSLDLDAVEMLKEVEVEESTTEFAISDRSETGLELFAYNICDVFVLELA
jgi:hypothetical protein